MMANGANLVYYGGDAEAFAGYLRTNLGLTINMIDKITAIIM